MRTHLYNCLSLISSLTFLFFCSPAYPVTRIAVLDFELNDITYLPNTEAEKSRTASIKPLLEQSLLGASDFDIVQIQPDEANPSRFGLGYLFKNEEIAVQLGKKYGADWIITGQHSKPSYLFSYLLMHVIHVASQSLAGEYAIELKGNHRKVLEHGVARLAKAMTDTISRQEWKIRRAK